MVYGSQDKVGFLPLQPIFTKLGLKSYRPWDLSLREPVRL